MSILKLEHISNINSSGNDLSIDTNGNIGIAMTPDSAVKLSVTGAIGPTNGTDAAPTHTFYGDPDTGMYRSGSNALSFSTGGSNALTLNSSQNASFAGTITGSSSITATTSINVGIGGGFYLKQDNSESTIRSESQPIVLQTYESSAWQDRVTVTNTGHVGIGISPGSPLHINMGTDKNIQFSGGIGEIGSVPGFQATNDASSGLRSLGMRGTSLRFATGSAERLRITDEVVGIGTDSPSTTDSGYNYGALHLHNASGSGSQLRLTNSTTGTGTSAGFMISKWSDSKTYITNFDDGKDVRFTISNSSGTLDSRVLCLKADATYGKVGIGTDSPEVVLEVNGDQAYDATDNTVVFGGRSGGGNGNNRRFNLAAYSSGGTYGGGIKIQTRDSANLFYNRMTIDHNGYVGIGTESPQRMLHIADGAATGLHITNDQSGHSSTEGFSQYIRDDNQDIEFVQRGNKRLVFYTNNTGLMAMKHDTATGSYPYISIGQDLSKADKMLHLYGVNPGVMVEGNSSGYTEGCFIQKCDDSYRGGGMYMYNGNGGSTDNEWFVGRVYASSADWRVCFKSGPSGVGQDTAQTSYTKLHIYQNGNYYFSGSNVSDERIKQDIVAETDQLTNVLALKPKTFKFKPEVDVNGDALEGAEASNTKHGLIAQDVLEVLPNLVTGDASNEDERLGVDYAALTSVLVKAIQELEARITALES